MVASRWTLVIAILLLAGCANAPAPETPSTSPASPPPPPLPMSPGPAPPTPPLHDDPLPTPAPEPAPRTYARRDEHAGDLTIAGNDTLVLDDVHYVVRGNVTLADNATLTIRNARFEHEKDHWLQYGLRAKDRARVIVENAEVANPCNGSLNWAFQDNATLFARDTRWEQCNTWFVFTNDARADVANWTFWGGTFCQRSQMEATRIEGLEVELCLGPGQVVDEALPARATEWTFPNEGEENVTIRLHATDATFTHWSLPLAPGIRVTARNATDVKASAGIGLPLRNETAVLEGLGIGHVDDTTWRIGDGWLRLQNVTMDELWEHDTYSGGNTLIVRNSTTAGASTSHGDGTLVVENSTVEILRANGHVRYVVRDSTVRQDVIAAEDSTIDLTNVTVLGRILEEGNGRVIVHVPP